MSQNWVFLLNLLFWMSKTSWKLELQWILLQLNYKVNSIKICISIYIYGFPWWINKEYTCQSRRCVFNPWVQKIPWRRNCQATLSILAWGIPWTEEPGGLQSMGLQMNQTQLSIQTPTMSLYQFHTKNNLNDLVCINSVGSLVSQLKRTIFQCIDML